MLLWLVVVASPTPEEIEAALQRLAQREEYQTVRPGESGVDDPGGTGRRPRPEKPPLEDVDSSEGFTWRERQVIGKAVIWVFVGIAVVLGLVWLAGSLANRGAGRLAPEEEPPVAAGEEELPLPDPEAFARAGDWTEAIHATLLHMIAEMTRRRLSPGWTSREILRRVKLAPAAQEPLRETVVLVERCLFAGAPAVEADYRRARDWGAAFRKAIAS